MIAIGRVVAVDEILNEHFVCDLVKCKGGCCVDGDAGAPLEQDELELLEKIYPAVEPDLTEAGKQEIAQKGFYVIDREFGAVTPTINNGMCAYGMVDERGIVKCAIEKAYNEGKIGKEWKKPISCHLFPIRIKESRTSVLLNYEPRPGLCDPACRLGKQLKVPVYQFLREALIRKFGADFFDALEATAGHLKDNKKK